MSVATSRRRFTIERLRTLVLAGGVLLLVIIAAVLVGGKWARRFINKDIPGRLGINIVQQADGVDYSQTRKGKTIFRIHANRAIKRKNDGSAVLQDVRIELYGEDGSRTDTISGKEFEYDPNHGTATAPGEVEITIMRPGVRPAIAELPVPGLKPKSVAKPSVGTSNRAREDSSSAGASGSPNPQLRGLTQAITDGQIHVKTSGLVFQQQDGRAATTQRVDFALRQGSGSANGATYDSQSGTLILDRDVEIRVKRDGDAAPVNINAAHAEFDRDARTCRLTTAKAHYSGETAQSGYALLHFRDDGSVSKLDGSNGVDLQSDQGSHVAAPSGTLDFDAANHPTSALLQGGAKFGLVQPDRTVEGTSPVAHLTFDKEGQLRLAHLEQGVEFHSRQQTLSGAGKPVLVTRSWRSQIADISFVPVQAAAGQQVKGELAGVHTQLGTSSAHVEPSLVRGSGGVIVTSETAAGGVVSPSRLAAESLIAELSSGSVLSSVNAAGRVSFEERGARGDHDTGSSDQLAIRFFPANAAPGAGAGGSAKSGRGVEGSEISSVVQTGHVVLTQEAGRVPEGSNAGPAAIRAVAARSEYDGTSQVVHLSGSPRVRDGSMDLSGDRIDLSRLTGDGLAQGHVRISWLSSGAAVPGPSLFGNAAASASANDPLNAVAGEVELHKAAQEVTLRADSKDSDGLHGEARLWQSVNSVAAPTIVLNRQKETLDAEARGVSLPVRSVLMSEVSKASGSRNHAPESNSSLIRIRSGSLHYSEGEHLAVFRRGGLPEVVAETTGTGGVATISAEQANVELVPRSPGAQARGDGTRTPQHSIDRLVASGNVRVEWPDQRGTGERLVYRGDDGTFTLTGSPATPPRIIDEARGSVSGSALIYHSGDASVTVEGDGGKTVTDTRSKR